MLLAVEGGGFFSSSASGYSKGLSLLLLGQKRDEKSMRVSPWNQYQLVDQESDLQLASRKNRLLRRCASFVCLGHAAAGTESPSPLKVGPTQQNDVVPSPLTDKGKDKIHTTNDVDGVSNLQLALKSNLKKPTDDVLVSSERESCCEKVNDAPAQLNRRTVQWTDTAGGELTEIREFEPSDTGESDDEFEDGNERTCSCRIM